MRAALVILCLMLLFESVAMVLMPERIRAWLEEITPGELRALGIVEAIVAVSGLLVAFLK